MDYHIYKSPNKTYLLPSCSTRGYIPHNSCPFYTKTSPNLPLCYSYLMPLLLFGPSAPQHLLPSQASFIKQTLLLILSLNNRLILLDCLNNSQNVWANTTCSRNLALHTLSREKLLKENTCIICNCFYLREAK